MADQYARDAAKITVSQLAEASGFEVVQQSSLDILADLLLRYLNEVGAASHSNAELCGRTDTNVLDITLALSDLGTSVDSLLKFARQKDNVPFAGSIVGFPEKRQLPSRTATFAAIQENPPPHIPAFLPAFPDAHTYKETEVFPARDQHDPLKRQDDLSYQKQEAQSALIHLQARLQPDNRVLKEAANDTLAIKGEDAEMMIDADTNKDNLSSNAFLAPTLWEINTNAMASTGVPPAPPAPWDWKAQLERSATLATSGQQYKDAFGEAYDASIAAKSGKRKVRSGALFDSTRARVEELLLRGTIDQEAEAGLEDEANVDIIKEQI